jgi:transketolase
VDPVVEKWKSFNWAVREIDGHDMAQILDALSWAIKHREGPAMIVARTLKGKGVSYMEDQALWHGKAPNKEQAEQALSELMQEELP